MKNNRKFLISTHAVSVYMCGYMYIYINGNHCQFYSSFLDFLKNKELSDYNRECSVCVNMFSFPQGEGKTLV